MLLGNDHFVVKPHRFEISAITCADDTVNPAASSAAEGKFCKAGENFTLEVKAVNALGAPTPNFGKETPPESVKVTSELVSGLELANNPQPFYSFAAFGKECGGEDESATACGTIRWSEVGIITLTPGVADGDYLGAGDVMGQSSGNIGRFYPHHFKIELPLTGEALIDRADLNTGDTEAVCSTPFTYLGEGFKTRFRLSARNAGNQITQNYDGAFAKLSLVSRNTYRFAASGLPTGAGLGPGDPAPAGAWSEGEAEVTAHHEIGRPADGSVAPPATVTILAAPSGQRRRHHRLRSSRNPARSGDNVALRPPAAGERLWLLRTAVDAGGGAILERTVLGAQPGRQLHRDHERQPGRTRSRRHHHGNGLDPDRTGNASGRPGHDHAQPR